MNEFMIKTDIVKESFVAVGLEVKQVTWKRPENSDKLDVLVELDGDPFESNDRPVVICINVYDADDQCFVSGSTDIMPGDFEDDNTVSYSFYYDYIFRKACRAVLFVSSITPVSIDHMIAFLGKDYIPVEKAVKTLIPNKAGLYPHEILAISLAPSYWVDEKHDREFRWCCYGVKDLDELLGSLMQRGYITIGSVLDSIPAYSYHDVRRTAKAFGLRSGGTKAALIERLYKNLSVEQLEDVFLSRTYAITDRGKEAIKDDDYVMFVHRHSELDLDLYQMNRKLNGNTKGYLDSVKLEIEQKCLRLLERKEYGLYRNYLWYVADYELSSDSISDALKRYICLAYWRLSGLENITLNLENAIHDWFPYENSSLKLSPFEIKKIGECKERLLMTDDDFTNCVKNVVNELSAPFHAFSKDEIVNIIVSEMRMDKDSLISIYNSARARLQV